MAKMNNSDFSRLLATNDKALINELTKAPKKKARPPREFKGKGKGKEGKEKGRAFGGQDSDDDDAPQRKGKGAGKAGQKPGGAAGPKKKDVYEYRDRASERRDGKEEYAHVAAEFEHQEEVTIDESKYLGGDMAHTHLVKGLDYALLTKVRTEINKQKKHEELQEMRMQRKQPKKRSFENLVAGKVWRTIVETLHPHHSTFPQRMENMRKAIASGQKIRGAPSVFLPGRMAFEFETGMEQGRNDIPRILYMSKEDAPPVDLSKKVASVLPDTVTRVRDAIQKAVEERKQRKLNKTSGTEASYAVAKKINVKHKAKDADEDIFGGVAAYDINEIVKEAEAHRSASKASSRSSKDKENDKGNKGTKRSSWFDDAGAEKYRKGAEKQLEPEDMVVEEKPGDADEEEAAASAQAAPAFEKADRFEGPRKGWSFKLGSQGLGYYKDGGAGSATASASSSAGERAGNSLRAAKKAARTQPVDENAYDECFPDSGLGGAMMTTMDGDSDDEEDGKKKKKKGDDKANDTMESSAYGKKSGVPGEGKKKKMSEAQEWNKINHMIKNNKNKSIGELEASVRSKRDPPMPRELTATPAFF